jgi:ubiquinol-cytochrome c reductase cytochrome b subunit
VPKPDFPFLWIYAVLSYLPPSMETPFILIAPILMIAGLLAVPFVASEGEKSWHRRPVAVLALSPRSGRLGRVSRIWRPVRRGART